jgi:hypothetical protein
MKFAAIMDEKHGNRLHIKITDIKAGDFLFGDWKNFEGRERRRNGKVVNSKGNRSFALSIPQEQFISDPLFEELVRRNMNFYELKPNDEYEPEDGVYQSQYAMTIKIRYAHDPENPWKDPRISTFDGSELEDLEESDLVDLDHYRLVGGTIECHSYDGERCSLYLDDGVFEIEKQRRENIRDKYRALLHRDESDEEPIPFN